MGTQVSRPAGQRGELDDGRHDVRGQLRGLKRHEGGLGHQGQVGQGLRAEQNVLAIFKRCLFLLKTPQRRTK